MAVDRSLPGRSVLARRILALSRPSSLSFGEPQKRLSRALSDVPVEVPLPHPR